MSIINLIFLPNNESLIVLVWIVSHGHGDVKFVHYALELYAAVSNLTIWSFVRFL